MDLLSERGALICVCPLTEGFLGDGIPHIAATDHLCLGTDCNNRIDFIEEMRWLSYCQNMKLNSRNCAGLNASKLIKIATVNGAKSLGLGGVVGEFEANHYMDFTAINIQSSRLVGFTAQEQLADALVFGGSSEDISMAGVAGCVLSRK